MDIGHPELVAAIASEIAISGPIPFVRFMDLALYHPQFGYYMRHPDDGNPRIGWSGDFYTSADVHSILGQAVAKQARQIDDRLGNPDPFTIVEMGPGKGLLAAHILSACQRDSGSFPHRLRYVLIERSPAMRQRQRQHLSVFMNQPNLLTWADSLDELGPGSVTGLMFSNELIDAFPVHRVQLSNGQIEELHVDYRDGRFVECAKPLSSDLLSHRVRDMKTGWPEGYRTEVNLQALDWMNQVGRCLQRGVVLTIDYGHTVQDLYRPDRKNGTFLCYFRHSVNNDPYVRVGEQDMTAHVDFSNLAATGEAHGLSVTGFTNQLSFLMGLGVEQMIGDLEPESPAFHAACHLLKPNGMGGTFKVLVQHKGIEHPRLDGLAFKPFFGAALTAQSAA
ncbi:MAG: class I SAM-dependent methyltransferase [Nitrospira sp.]|nr:class I SAM-dependent methyltransferase [Nitrospira sp.]